MLKGVLMVGNVTSIMAFVANPILPHEFGPIKKVAYEVYLMERKSL